MVPTPKKFQKKRPMREEQSTKLNVGPEKIKETAAIPQINRELEIRGNGENTKFTSINGTRIYDLGNGEKSTLNLVHVTGNRYQLYEDEDITLNTATNCQPKSGLGGVGSAIINTLAEGESSAPIAAQREFDPTTGDHANGVDGMLEDCEDAAST